MYFIAYDTSLPLHKMPPEIGTLKRKNPSDTPQIYFFKTILISLYNLNNEKSFLLLTFGTYFMPIFHVSRACYDAPSTTLSVMKTS